jgi:hypothetical protein
MSLDDVIENSPPCMSTLLKQAFNLDISEHLAYQSRWAFTNYLCTFNVQWNIIENRLLPKLTQSYNSDSLIKKTLNEMRTMYNSCLETAHAKRTSYACNTMSQKNLCTMESSQCHQQLKQRLNIKYHYENIFKSPLHYVRQMLKKNTYKRRSRNPT